MKMTDKEKIDLLTETVEFYATACGAEKLSSRLKSPNDVDLARCLEHFAEDCGDKALETLKKISKDLTEKKS